MARDLAPRLAPGMVVRLRGELGTGKSVFARALGSALGVQEPMPSPTFAIIHEYRGTGEVPVLHVDLYRIANSEEYQLLALDELLDGAIAIVEWPERAGAALDSRSVTVTIGREADESRIITMEWSDARTGH